MNDPLAFSLIQAAHRIEGRLERALESAKLSHPKFVALSVLVAQEQPISLGDLADKLTCVRSNVTQLVDRLEAEGLAKRIDDPADRRAIRAQVTKLGRERQAAGQKAVDAVLKEIAGEMSGVNADLLARTVASIR